jgi:hypothetical protein
LPIDPQFVGCTLRNEPQEAGDAMDSIHRHPRIVFFREGSLRLMIDETPAREYRHAL